MGESLPPAYFDAIYAENPDPWGFETSDYERAKYAATLAALPRARFARGFEPGCANGVLTAQLAPRCDALLAVDVAERALARARQRCAGRKGVTIRAMQVPREWPTGGFDLIVFSEMLYYLSAAELALAAARAAGSLEPDGAVLLVHYVLPTDYPLGGDTAAEQFIACSLLRPVRQLREAAYRLDVLLR